MILLTAYTPNYRRDADKLRRSAEQFASVDRVIDHAYADQGSWEKNCAMKPSIILHHLVARRETIAWVDADALVWGTLEPLHALAQPLDFLYATREARDNEILSGTLIVNPTDAGIELVDDWHRRCIGDPQTWDQKHLAKAIAASTGRRAIMPPAYCYIFDIFKREHPNVKPIVEHFQASREEKHNR